MIAIVVAALAAAQPSAPAEHNCDDPMSQNEMNACAALDFERADAELNRAWREAVAAAREADAEIDRNYDQRPTSEAKLREAQRAWIVYRDAHCTVVGYEEARGGSMEPMTYDGCRKTLTEERTAQLRSLPVDE
jgi:uncharacterized protein YecT (DUF1311 family)